jgi:hypothetical protein
MQNPKVAVDVAAEFSLCTMPPMIESTFSRLEGGSVQLQHDVASLSSRYACVSCSIIQTELGCPDCIVTLIHRPKINGVQIDSGSDPEEDKSAHQTHRAFVPKPDIG